MNKLKAVIKNISSSDNISLVDLEANNSTFSAVIIETKETADYLFEGSEVEILFKETEVSIAKNFNGQISLRNRMNSKIVRIERGIVLSKIILDFNGEEICSIITTRSVEKLELKESDEVTGLVKANEISILKEKS